MSSWSNGIEPSVVLNLAVPMGSAYRYPPYITPKNLAGLDGYRRFVIGRSCAKVSTRSDGSYCFYGVDRTSVTPGIPGELSTCVAFLLHLDEALRE